MNGKDDSTLFGYHVVCLIDVLGQKDKLAQWADLPADGRITPDFLAAIRQTVGTVVTFRDSFIEFFDLLSQCTMPDALAALTQKQQEQYNRCKHCNVRVERFSDTFLFHSLVPNPAGDISVVPLYRVLSACCMAMLSSLAAKAPVRGAITFGAGAVLEDNAFYGPALAEAYHLESEVAGYPRVVVSRSAWEFLAEGQTYSGDAVVAQIMAELAGICRSLICEDADGCRIVDFLGQGMDHVLGPLTEAGNAAKTAHDFVQSEAKRFRVAGNAKLALRYHLLQQYIEPRLPLWEVGAGAGR